MHYHQQDNQGRIQDYCLVGARQKREKEPKTKRKENNKKGHS